MKKPITNALVELIAVSWSGFYYDHLPRFVRRYMSFVIEPVLKLGSKFFSLLNHFYLPMYLLYGKEKTSGITITVLFLSDENSFSYLSDLLFSEEYTCEKIGNVGIWNVGRRLEKFSAGIDAVFIKSDRFFSCFFQKHGFTVIPEYISTTLDVSEPLEQIYKKFNKSAKKEIKQLEKHDYSYEISTDIDKLKFFYHRMYLSYAYRRYGKSARCVDFNVMRSVFEKGKLILVKEGDEYISGFLVNIDKDTVTITCSGIMDGKTDYLRRHIGAARYCFSILWAKENGFKQLHFGFSRPFLNDGVLRYKRKWGATARKCRSDFVAGSYAGIFGFKTYTCNEGILDFLVHNPFIYFNKNQLEEKNLCTNELMNMCICKNFSNKVFKSPNKDFILMINKNMIMCLKKILGKRS